MEKISTDFEFMKARVIVTPSEISSHVAIRPKSTIHHVVHFIKVRSVVTLLFIFFLFIKKTKQKWSQNQVFSTKKHHYPQMIINMHIPDNTVSVLHSTYSTSTHHSNIS